MPASDRADCRRGQGSAATRRCRPGSGPPYLVASHTPGMSAVQFQRQLGIARYETAFQILHKLRAGMVRPDRDRIGGRANEHVEVDESWVGGRTRGEGRGVDHKVLVACTVEVRHRKPGTAQDKRGDGRYAGRVRLAVAADRSAKSLCGFVGGAVAPGTLIVTDDWSGYAGLRKHGYDLTTPLLNVGIPKWQRSSCPSSISSSPISRRG